jgi:hypothetical protein
VVLLPEVSYVCVCDGGGRGGMNISPGGHNQQGGDTELWGVGGVTHSAMQFYGGGGG